MEINYGAEVKDKNGKVIGTVNYVTRNTITGTVSKFIVYQKGNAPDLYYTPADVEEATETTVTLKVAVDS
ncbi:MAG: hypothetical protein Q8P44_04265 [Dehalococcoidia bacterium]|nr:hypothetical protein [Dehalococcoidia bacterium]